MDKIKTLLTGKNTLIMDEMFHHLSDEFDLLTCSGRYEDRLKHIDLFKPDVFVICLNGETRGELNSCVELKRKLTRMGIATVVIGFEEECAEFQNIAVQMDDLIIKRPVKVETIRDEIVRLMIRIRQEREEQAVMQKKLEEIKAMLERKHVLIIDDDPVMLKVIKEYLTENYDVATAISGKIAYKFLDTKETNLILLDYEMPNENGPTILKKIREMEKYASVPVVFLTSITDKDKIREALSLRPQGYLVKPVDRDKLLGTVEKFIG